MNAIFMDFKKINPEWLNPLRQKSPSTVYSKHHPFYNRVTILRDVFCGYINYQWTGYQQDIIIEQFEGQQPDMVKCTPITMYLNFTIQCRFHVAGYMGGVK